MLQEAGLNVVFDLLIPWGLDKEETAAIKHRIKAELKKGSSGHKNPVITVEHGY